VLKVLANHHTSKWWFVTAVYGSDVFAVGVDPNAATFATATSGHFSPTVQAENVLSSCSIA
jgi:hypothetical protein